LALQLRKQLLNLTPSANGDPAFAVSLFDLHLVQVPQIKHHLVGNHRLAPGMESADGPNTTAPTSGHDREQLLFRPWRVNLGRLKTHVATKVLDYTRSQDTHSSFKLSVSRNSTYAGYASRGEGIIMTDHFAWN
jgi:hypothetical protein